LAASFCLKGCPLLPDFVAEVAEKRDLSIPKIISARSDDAIWTIDADIAYAPRAFFEDPILWGTAAKLKNVIVLKSAM
jgi:hypothetical protein